MELVYKKNKIMFSESLLFLGYLVNESRKQKGLHFPSISLLFILIITLERNVATGFQSMSVCSLRALLKKCVKSACVRSGVHKRGAGGAVGPPAWLNC